MKFKGKEFYFFGINQSDSTYKNSSEKYQNNFYYELNSSDYIFTGCNFSDKIAEDLYNKFVFILYFNKDTTYKYRMRL